MIKKYGKFLIAGFILWTLFENFNIKITRFNIESGKIPKEFSGFKIVQVSDFHNSELKQIIGKIRKEKPDIIVITGDLISSYHTKNENAFDFIEGAVKIAPCFFVTGNHESRLEDYKKIENFLINHGVIVLKDEIFTIKRGNGEIDIWGIDDPSFLGKNDFSRNIIREKLEKFPNPDKFTILLSHRPEAFDEYVNKGIDLSLTGHTHGGQVRIPIIGAIIAPNQGFFPKYDEGIFKKNDSAMIISKGIGHSIIPIRINSRPEIVSITLLNIKKNIDFNIGRGLS